MVLLGALPRNIVPEIKFNINICTVSPPKIKAIYDDSQLHFIGHLWISLCQLIQDGNRAWSIWIQISSNEVLLCILSRSSQWVIELYDWYVFNPSIDIKNMEAHVNSFVFIQWNKAQPDSREHLKAPCMNLAVESSKVPLELAENMKIMSWSTRIDFMIDCFVKSLQICWCSKQSCLYPEKDEDRGRNFTTKFLNFNVTPHSEPENSTGFQNK